MKIHKSIQADSSGRINLGKDCAGLLFTFCRENNRIILEPALVVPEREFRQKEGKGVLLNEEEWERFQTIVEADDEPTSSLKNLMKKKS